MTERMAEKYLYPTLTADRERQSRKRRMTPERFKLSQICRFIRQHAFRAMVDGDCVKFSLPWSDRAGNHGYDTIRVRTLHDAKIELGY